MSSDEARHPMLPRFTVREAQMAEFLADAGNMLQALRDAEQRIRDQRVLLERAATKLQAQCDRVDETADRLSTAIDSADKAARERFTKTVVEQTRRALEQALAEVHAAGEAERLRMGRPAAAHTGAEAALPASKGTDVDRNGTANTPAPQAAAGSVTPPGSVPAASAPMCSIEPLRTARPPLWRRYPNVNLLISAALLGVAYFIAR